MLRKLILPLCLAAAVSTACDEDDTTTDENSASADDGGVNTGDGGFARDGGGIDGGRGRLQSGTYSVSNVVELEDECQLQLDDGTFTSTELVNTGTELSIGRRYDETTDPSWTPAGYGLGSGPYTTSTTATLTTSTHVRIAADGCEFDVERTTLVTFTGENSVSVDYTDDETNHNERCRASSGLPTEDCTSHYTFDLVREGL